MHIDNLDKAVVLRDALENWEQGKRDIEMMIRRNTDPKEEEACKNQWNGKWWQKFHMLFTDKFGEKNLHVGQQPIGDHNHGMTMNVGLDDMEEMEIFKEFVQKIIDKRRKQLEQIIEE